MDIKHVASSSPATSAVNARPVTESLHKQAEHRAAEAAARDKRTVHEATHDSPPRRVLALGADVRLQLYVDESTNEVYGRVFDRESGELLREIPSKELRALRAYADALIGPFVNQLA
ncbi:MAG TPA: flagellar protein FlaG [Alphaproteobacteria bacterium]|jgi:uncharacterized FlaG/YvyC family protein